MVTATRPSLQPVQANGRTSIPVPWARADDLQVRLRRAGIDTVLTLNPASRTASLELLQEGDADKALRHLEAWVAEPGFKPL